MIDTPSIYTEDIAIIGMACRLPGAQNIQKFWENLRNGVESIAHLSEQEIASSGIASSLLAHPNYVRAEGTLEGIEMFDAAFFGIHPREAEVMDPQHRLFLECAWTALEHAGYEPETYKGSIGVYAGAGLNSYLLFNLHSHRDLIETVGAFQVEIGNDKDYLATRTSYKLNLKGPSIAVQTACSSSLVAVHLACQSLLNYQCDMALAGGVSIRVPQKAGYLYQEDSILSPDGHCRTFDANAKGTVPGNGVGIVLLKRLEDALRDGDTIHAVIKGSAINNDGSLKVGYTAPSITGQAQVIATAEALAEVDPQTISYIEAHGTATALGDPIEINALTQVFRQHTQQRAYCAIGSVKTNIGHLDTASGIAGLIKTVLALKHRELPPSLHFETPNPKIDFASSPFFVNTTLTPWIATHHPRRAGVSSFGIGGTNAHVILEEAPSLTPSDPPMRPWHLLLLSARTLNSLELATTDMTTYLRQQPELVLADIAYTSQVGRRAFSQRRMLVCRNQEEAITILEKRDPQRLLSAMNHPSPVSVAFLFPGQGSQYVGMGRELYEHEPIFRDQIDHCAELLHPYLDVDIHALLYPGSTQQVWAQECLQQTHFTQPVLFVIEYALAQLWMSWGIKPQALLGHSIGEYVAACLAGACTLVEALHLVVARGALMQQISGAMLALPLSEERVRQEISAELSVAAINGPEQCVVSGSVEAITALEQRLHLRGIEGRRLRSEHAFHSEAMQKLDTAFREQAGKVNWQTPQIPFISNVTGDWITTEQVRDPGYWAEHAWSPVLFAQGLKTLMQQSDLILLEVGPGQSLSSLAIQNLGKTSGERIFSSLSLSVQKSEMASLLNTLGRLWLAGTDIDWLSFHRDEQRKRVPLPTYNFERERFWIEPYNQVPAETVGQDKPEKKVDIADWFYIPIWKRSSLRNTLQQDISVDRQRCWLVFVDECGFGSQIVNQLEGEGQEVINIIAKERFAKINDREYEIRPGQCEDYEALFKELFELHKVPQYILHVWNVTAETSEQQRSLHSDSLLDTSFYSMLFLMQALSKHSFTTPLLMGVITNHMQEVIGGEILHPEKATILGPSKVLMKEFPNVTCRSIDIILPQSKTRLEKKLVEQIIAELRQPSSDLVVAYRGDYRWVQMFEATQLEQVNENTIPLREKGVYLVTGGLGGIGLVLARYLSRAKDAKIILIGRSGLPERKTWLQWLADHSEQDRTSYIIRQIVAIEELGAEVMVANVDVSDLDQMRQVISQVRDRFGDVQGVIHAAGVPGGGMIQLKKPNDASKVLAPKIKGTFVLASVLKDTVLDFFVLCSSVSSILGEFGQVDYCAANAFLDAFAHYYTATNNIFTVSINWDRWQEVGMGKNVNTLFRNTTGQQQKPYHPFLQICIIDSPEQLVYCARFNVAKDWILHEHRIKGNAVIPGTVYLEMVRAAFEQREGNSRIILRDVFFITPLEVGDDEEKEVYTILEKKDNAYRFRVVSRISSMENEEFGWEDHATGIIDFLGGEGTRQHEISAILQKCSEMEIQVDEEMLRHDKNMYYGPRWNVLKKVYVGPQQRLAVLELPTAFLNDLEQFHLHPSLLDVATALAMYQVGETDQAFYLPLSYKTLRMNSPLFRYMYSYIQFKETHYFGDKLIVCDVSLLDEGGVELVGIEEFTMVRVEEDILAARSEKLFKEGKREDALYEMLTTGNNTPERDTNTGILSKEGVEAFHRILVHKISPQVVVATSNLNQLIAKADAITQENFVTTEKGKALIPKHDRPDMLIQYSVPTSELEQKVANIWQEVFSFEQIGVHDNFFELGGHSLLAIQLISRLREIFQIEFPLNQLFETPTVAGVAKVIMGMDSKEEERIAQLLAEIENLTPDELQLEMKKELDNTEGNLNG